VLVPSVRKFILELERPCYGYGYQL